MNIYGIGTDIGNIKRIKAAIKRNNQAFKKKIYTNFEVKICEKRKNKFECFAKRFAAKEALFKAIAVKNKLDFKDVLIRPKRSTLQSRKDVILHRKYKFRNMISLVSP